MADGAVAEQHQLVPTLAEGQEQRQQRGADQQPLADRHRHGDRAGHRPKDEAASDRQHVDDDDVLQRGRVHQQQRHVASGRQRNHGTDEECCRKGCSAQNRSGERGRSRRELARGDRPHPFQRMPLVGIAVGDVVEQIDRPRQRAEDRERRKSQEEGGWIREASAEQQPGKDDQVLGPLFWPERDKEQRQQEAMGSRIRSTAHVGSGVPEIRSRRGRHTRHHSANTLRLLTR